MTWLRFGQAILLTLALAGCATTPGTGRPDQPPNTAAEKASQANTQLGVRYLRDGELQKALRKLQKAMRQNPQNASAYTVAGVVYERLDEPERAASHYERAVDLAPNSGAALNNYGRFLCDRGDREQAFGLFQRAADNPLYERSELALTNAGVCALGAGQEKVAEDYLLQALKANGEYARALLRMAEVRYRQEHYMNARAFYQRFLSVESQTPESAWLGMRIEHELGNEDAVASYRLLLTNRFAESEQTRRMLEWESDGRL